MSYGVLASRHEGAGTCGAESQATSSRAQPRPRGSCHRRRHRSNLRESPRTWAGEPYRRHTPSSWRMPSMPRSSSSSSCRLPTSPHRNRFGVVAGRSDSLSAKCWRRRVIARDEACPYHVCRPRRLPVHARGVGFATTSVAARIGATVCPVPLEVIEAALRVEPYDDIFGAMRLCLLLCPKGC